MTTKEITGFAAAALMLALAAWFWFDDLRAKSLGVPVIGVYTGQYARFTSNSKFGGEETSAQLLLDIVPPDGVPRRVRMIDLTAFDALPDEGTEIPLLWLASEPETARSATALASPIGQNAAWLAGIAALLFVATLADVISRRRKSG